MGKRILSITFLALAFSARADKAAPPTPEEIYRMAYRAVVDDRLAKRPPEKNGKILYGMSGSENDKALLVQSTIEVGRELVKRGLSPEQARDAATRAIAQVPAVRDSCDFHVEGSVPTLDLNPPPPAEPDSQSASLLRTQLGLQGKICDVGEQLIKTSLLSAGEAIANEIAKGALEKPPEPGKPTDPGPPPGDEKSDDKIVGTDPKPAEPAVPPAVRPGPALPALSGITARLGMLDSSPRTVELGPSIGTGAQPGASPSSDFHRGASQPSQAPAVSSARSGEENVEALRQALQEKVISREMEPAVADALMKKFSPILRKEPDLEAALQKAQMDLNPNQVQKMPIPEEAPPAVAEKKTVAQAESKPTEPTPPALEKVDPTIWGPGSWMVMPQGLLPGAPPKNLSKKAEGLAGSIAAAIQKKNAQPMLEGDSSASSESLIAPPPGPSSSFSAPSNQPIFTKSLEPSKRTLAGSSAFRSFLDQMASTLDPRSASRNPASLKNSKLAEWEDATLLALASLGGDEKQWRPVVQTWLPFLFFFLVPFTTTLVGFALWSALFRRRRTARRVR